MALACCRVKADLLGPGGWIPRSQGDLDLKRSKLDTYVDIGPFCAHFGPYGTIYII